MGDSMGEELIRLNVGGVYYCTAKTTLQSQDSIFTTLLQAQPQYKDEKGEYYFIDR